MEEKIGATWLEDLHIGKDHLRNALAKINRLTEDLDAVGFYVLAKRCAVVSALIEAAGTAIDRGEGRTLTEQLKNAQDMSASILRATLAGAIVGGQL